MVGVVRVAPLDPRHRGNRELRLELEDRLRLFRGRRGRVPGKLQHLRDVRDVFRPEPLRLLVGLRVVVAVGQTQAALERRHDDLARVLAVLLRADLEEGADSPLLEARDLLLERSLVVNRGDPVELSLERRDPGRLDRGLIHAAPVEVGELSLLGPRRRRRPGGELLQGLVQDLAVPLVQLVERAPARVIGRHRVLLQPPAVGVLVEVAAGGHARIHVPGIKSTRGRGCGAAAAPSPARRRRPARSRSSRPGEDPSPDRASNRSSAVAA